MDIKEAYSLLKADILESREESRTFQTTTRRDLGEIKDRVTILETKDSIITKSRGYVIGAFLSVATGLCVWLIKG